MISIKSTTGSSYGQRGDRSPHCHFRTVRATLTAHGSSAIWSLVIDTDCSAQNMKDYRRCLHDTRRTHVSMVLCLLSPVTASRSFQITVLTSAYPGHYPRPLLLEESSPFSHAVDTCSHPRERKNGFPRSDGPFCAALGFCFPPGFVGVNTDHADKCRPLFLSMLDQA